MRVIFILRANTSDALWAAEQNLKRRVQIPLGLRPDVTWVNPQPAQFINLGPDDCIVCDSLASLLDLEEKQVQYPGEVVKGKWEFLFRNPPGRFIFCNEPEGRDGFLDTNLQTDKFAKWAIRFRATPLHELPGANQRGPLPYSVKEVHSAPGEVRQVVPDEAQEAVEDLMVRLYTEDHLSQREIAATLRERNIRGPRGGVYTAHKVGQLLKKRGVRPRRSKIRALMAREDNGEEG